MSFDLNEMHTVIGIWYVAYSDRDFLAMAWLATRHDTPHLRFRIRNYAEDSTDPFDERDEQSWFDIEAAHKSPEEIIDRQRAVIASLLEQWPQAPQVVDELAGPVSRDAALQWLMTRSWAHLQVQDGSPDA